jgi:hypothetical protein
MKSAALLGFQTGVQRKDVSAPAASFQLRNEFLEATQHEYALTDFLFHDGRLRVGVRGKNARHPNLAGR